MRLRHLPSQKRGQIVTKRNCILPLSGKKNLNLGNIPILLVEKNDSLIDVFPKSAQDECISVRDGLIQMLEQGPHDAIDIPSVENLARSRLIVDSKLIEQGLSFEGKEVEVPAGFIDLLFRDALGRLLVVEMKREGNDATIGQIIRLTASLGQAEKVESTKLRMMIICSRMNRHVEQAAKFADVETHIDSVLFRLES